MARRGRKPKSADQKLKDALERAQPAEYILERRKLFAGIVQPPAKDRLDGRSGEIDSEVCDAIGQLCALGYFDNHGHDPIEMRDKGRFWGGHLTQLLRPLGVKQGSFEPRSRSTNSSSAMTKEDLMFDRMDENLPQYERSVLYDLVVTPLLGGREFPFWAQALIDDELLRRKRIRPGLMLVGHVTESERGLLAAVIRGLCVLIDGSLPARFERHAA